MEKKCFYKTGETSILSLQLAQKLIDEISNLDLEKIEKEIKENPNAEKWLKLNDNI